MRPGNQSNKRMRGRGRKGPNPLSRTYESNGPDVKIRGTAQHVAEKYQQLARDAQASGDRIMSENYFQHAEHYLRIVAAAQPSQPAVTQHGGRDASDEGDDDSPVQNNGGDRRHRPEHSARSGQDATVGEDSPQPFIDDMPVIDDAGQVNGAASKTSDEGDGEDGKVRRRIRGTRGKGVKRSDGEGSTEAEAVSAVEGEEEAPKPKRRPGRPRRAKVADEASEAEPVPAGE